ncbi:diguanylate cyclase [Tardiphaga sp. vice278]|nr:diguanylate cyclase [Tardiphaga sp. vice278]
MAGEPRRVYMLDEKDTLPLVCVFERDEGIEELLSVVRQMNFNAIRGGKGDFGAGSCGRNNVTTVLVSDNVERSFELCASIPTHIPKILVASNTSFDFRLAAARADITAILQRPLQIGELGDWLKQFAAERSVLAASILIVDDDHITAELHAEILRSAGMSVYIVSDPVEALTAIEATSHGLVLMDVQMPGVDGIELARMMRQSRQHMAMPIVFLSAEQDLDRQLAARRFGGDIFINKPVDPKHLVSLVRLRADRSRTLRSMIERDSLTGLYNHGQFKDRLIHEFERSRRTGSPLSIVMIDIDNFKSVNDRYGHPVGDRVIRGVATLLTNRLRRTDVVGRYGGEEFGILMMDTPPCAAGKVVDNIRTMLGDFLFDASGQSFAATFSAGVAGAAASDSPENCIARADSALYLAKREGRNRVRLAAADMEMIGSAE